MIIIWMELKRLVMMKIQCYNYENVNDGKDDHMSDDEIGDDEGVNAMTVAVVMMVTT